MLTITIHRAADLTPDDRTSIARHFYAAFPWEVGNDYDFTDHYLRLWDGDQLVSLVAITDRVITVGGQPVRVGGIGDVSTREDRRGQGHASLLMREAARLMLDDLGMDFGMLFCGENRIPFYEHLGWALIRQPAHWIDEAAVEQVEPHFMILAPTGSAWPSGAVDLCGGDW
jgi:aminoglycoside 2'-N-acetyltransferase I